MISKIPFAQVWHRDYQLGYCCTPGIQTHHTIPHTGNQLTQSCLVHHLANNLDHHKMGLAVPGQSGNQVAVVFVVVEGEEGAPSEAEALLGGPLGQ